METKVFRPRFSVLGIILFFSFMIFQLLYLWIKLYTRDDMNHTGLYILIGIFILFILFFVEYARSVRIEITDQKLIVKGLGGTFWSCELSQITSVESTYKPWNLSAFVMLSSFRNLCVRYRSIHGFSAYSRITPANEQEFLETLKKLNPNIIFHVKTKKGWWRIWDWDI